MAGQPEARGIGVADQIAAAREASERESVLGRDAHRERGRRRHRDQHARAGHQRFLVDWGRKYWHGLQTVGATQVYTNRGIGTIGLPVRLGSKPEITQITLQLESKTS